MAMTHGELRKRYDEWLRGRLAGEALFDLGFATDDLHGQNIGWIGKKLVCIDFGDEST